MLTREESENLIIHMQDLFSSKNCTSSNSISQCMSSLENHIKELTEKPNREIQVGDIYLDKEGFIVEIISSDIENISNHPLGVMSKCGYVYDKRDGRYIGELDRADLDMSSRYKLTEMEDE